MKLLLAFGIAFAAFPISHSTEAFCSLTHDEGTGMNFTFALYYDASIDLCQPFLYRGEGGNANSFRNERECIRTCSSKAEESYPMDESLACHFRKAKGQCGGQYLRFYYDSIHDKCKTFLWTGCIGNGNRFVDRESCNATCAGIHDEGDEVEEEEPDTPVGE
ncbi:inter-alpha-trypsin inhibitor [Diretmus argenteus]